MAGIKPMHSSSVAELEHLIMNSMEEPFDIHGPSAVLEIPARCSG